MPFPNLNGYVVEAEERSLRSRSISDIIEDVKHQSKDASFCEHIHDIMSTHSLSHFNLVANTLIDVHAPFVGSTNIGPECARGQRDLPSHLQTPYDQSKKAAGDLGATDRLEKLERLKRTYMAQMEAINSSHNVFLEKYKLSLDPYGPEHLCRMVLSQAQDRMAVQLKKLDTRFLQALTISEKKRPRNHPKHAVVVMQKWLDGHFHHPYPSDREKIMLATETGITVGMVNNWFINNRGRHWRVKMKKLSSGDSQSSSNVVSLIADTHSVYSKHLGGAAAKKKKKMANSVVGSCPIGWETGRTVVRAAKKTVKMEKRTDH